MHQVLSPGGDRTVDHQNAVSQFVVFKLGDNEFGVAIERVQEILILGPLARVPKAPAFVEGIVNVRGKILPVLNLCKRLGIATRGQNDDARIIVVESADQTVGMIVDMVTEVVKFPSAGIEPPPPLITTVAAKFVTGVVGKPNSRILVILNLDRILSSDELLEVAGTAGTMAEPREAASVSTPLG
jgi:purine-binding chemotaxis protein CheW